jgi:hypothetical protein
MKRIIGAIVIQLASLVVSQAKDAIVYVKPPQPILIGAYDLDLDEDGQIDFHFYSQAESSADLFVVPRRNNRALVFLPYSWLAPISEKYLIGPIQYSYPWIGTNFPATQGAALLASRGVLDPSGTRGAFVSGITYMGVAIEIQGVTHYGWVRIQNVDGQPIAYILDWAYESRPDTAIRAGDKHIRHAPHHAGASIVRPGHLRLHWESEPGTAYRVQHTSEINGPWVDLGFVVVASSTNCIVEVPMSNTAGFYRMVPE